MKLNKIVKIQGHKYLVSHYMPEPAMTLLFDVADIITPVLDDLDAEAVSKVIAHFTETDTEEVPKESIFETDENMPTMPPQKKESFADANDIEMLKMLSPLLKKLKNTDMNKLLHRICNKVIYSGIDETYDFEDGTPEPYSETGKLSAHWDEHFMGKPFLVFKIAWEMLSFNYASFLDGNPVTHALLEKTQKIQK